MDWSESSDFQDVTENAADIIRTAEFPDAEEWIDALHNGHFHAFAAKGGFPGRLVRHAVFSSSRYLSSFESLQVVDYGGNVPRPVKRYSEHDVEGYQQPDDFSTPCNRAQFMVWFYLPSIHRLEIWLRDVEELKAGPPDLSHLESLILARSTISEQDVPFLLTRAKNLKNLHLGLCHGWAKQPFYEHSDCLAEGLLSVRDTVERLSIGLDYHPCIHEGLDEELAKEESRAVLHGIFAQFSRLQTLEVPTTLLFGFDTIEVDLDDCSILPKTLVDLVLRFDLDNLWWFYWETWSVQDFGASIMQNLPDFPHLRCILSRSHKRYFRHVRPEDGWQMHQMFKEHGIDFNVVVDSLGAGLWSSGGSVKLYQ
ncbi:hypothetical protein ASPVEDRAFT_83598 [Aspergillus versicolor CBS 583.65]|uniref:Uncharacterized protein n=1 Tax=Aspergillus versicolor CBS 583.65 TaxID=1036611 RepID=A0A1L9PKL7_ASPVE|nr:uncharacterized protein ASPVEDRAFT_83598 [Aspergillus versicolor CBS 583.65]OJJ02078.1 hypothetical protein ASPVEDRAFT_83598 [Aspergillus versicolor CBS 583.65]